MVNFVLLNLRVPMTRSSKDSIDNSKAKFGGYNVGYIGNILFHERSKRKSNSFAVRKLLLSSPVCVCRVQKSCEHEQQ